MKKLSKSIENEVINLLYQGISQPKIAQQLGISRDSVGRIKSQNNIRLGPESILPGERINANIGEKIGSLEIDVTHERNKKPRWLDIKNPATLLKRCNVDEKVWAVDNCRVSSSEVTMKIRTTKGKISKDKPATFTNVHVSVRLKRRIPSEQAINNMCERLLKNKIKPAKIKYHVQKDSVLLEWCPFDHHHGLLAWGPEVGANWDLKISEQFFDKAATDVLHKASPYNIGQIVIPIGQDWFHCDDPSFQTPMGKHRLDIEGRLIKVFETGYWSLFRGIERLRQIAPVHLLWVPGNHDPQTSYYLTRALAAHYMDLDGKFRRGVTVDFSPMSRKLYRWGKSAIGFSHPINRGQWEKQRGIFAELFKHEWADADHHEIHTGHLICQFTTRVKLEKSSVLKSGEKSSVFEKK